MQRFVRNSLMKINLLASPAPGHCTVPVFPLFQLLESDSAFRMKTFVKPWQLCEKSEFLTLVLNSWPWSEVSMLWEVFGNCGSALPRVLQWALKAPGYSTGGFSRISFACLSSWNKDVLYQLILDLTWLIDLRKLRDVSICANCVRIFAFLALPSQAQGIALEARPSTVFQIRVPF